LVLYQNIYTKLHTHSNSDNGANDEEKAGQQARPGAAEAYSKGVQAATVPSGAL